MCSSNTFESNPFHPRLPLVIYTLYKYTMHNVYIWLEFQGRRRLHLRGAFKPRVWGGQMLLYWIYHPHQFEILGRFTPLTIAYIRSNARWLSLYHLNVFELVIYGLCVSLTDATLHEPMVEGWFIAEWRPLDINRSHLCVYLLFDYVASDFNRADILPVLRTMSSQ